MIKISRINQLMKIKLQKVRTLSISIIKIMILFKGIQMQIKRSLDRNLVIFKVGELAVNLNKRQRKIQKK